LAKDRSEGTPMERKIWVDLDKTKLDEVVIPVSTIMSYANWIHVGHELTHRCVEKADFTLMVPMRSSISLSW